MGRMVRMAAIAALIAVFGTACSGDDGSSTTTSSTALENGSTTLSAADSGAAAETAADAAASTTVAQTTTTGGTGEFSVPQFTIVSREEGEDGDTVVVLLDTDSYESLTDIDLQNVLADVVEEFPPINEIHVVDSAEVVEFVNAESLTRAEQELLNVHYLVRLEEGFRIRFLGKFEANGVSILGS